MRSNMNKLQRTIDEGRARKARKGMTNINDTLRFTNPTVHIPKESNLIEASCYTLRYAIYNFRRGDKTRESRNRRIVQEVGHKLTRTGLPRSSPLINNICYRYKYHVYLNFCPHKDFIDRFLKYKSYHERSYVNIEIGTVIPIMNEQIPHFNPRSNIVATLENQPQGEAEIFT